MATNHWVLDPSHSEVQFKIKHLMITNVTGSFNLFEAHAVTEDDDFSNAKLSFKANIASINTNNEQRDTHLKSPDFFDVEKYPVLSFVSTKTEGSKGNGEFNLIGDLTIKDVTKPVKFNVEFGGITRDPYGQTKAGFSITGKINRKDFGLTWNAALESGGVMVGEDVKLVSEIQLIKQEQQ
jgi:polyisoprenoid-binding protein YceI